MVYLIILLIIATTVNIFTEEEVQDDISISEEQLETIVTFLKKILSLFGLLNAENLFSKLSMLPNFPFDDPSDFKPLLDKLAKQGTLSKQGGEYGLP